jgi:tetratricopeptide (TPR) repeat protein
MVADREAWLAIQKDQEANLALSPEEAELLESVHGKGLGGYPLFINGRAGSGKSTMLQYLAMEYVDFALRQDATRRPLYPLYMTCSKELLERARTTVRGLFKNNHRNLLKRKHDPSKIDEVIDRCFVVFHDFLYSLLPVDRREEFPRDKYVNYAEFLRLWEEDFAKWPEARHISPDIAWHTIRSYIKRMRSSLDDDLGPEEYQSIPSKRRSVSEATYKQIYESVWTRWYKRRCEEENYWDDQDLAAAVKDSDSLRQFNCPAIFCDEAQDFTRIELEIIYQLSLFGRRSLNAEEVARVPIVFAGDPLQTINPTGFRWEAVQAVFYDRFCAVLDPRRRANVTLSYRELHFNYRSNPGIVRFCNLIQLVRAATLGIRDLQPQKAWWVDQSVQPVCFAVEDPMTEQQPKQHEGLVKLVNCEQGGETEYVKGDSILKNLEEQAEGIYRNVLGPTRAKGLEFSDVVLYKFGETAPEKFADLLNGQVDLNVPEIRLPYEYFFNRLYVAASRAKNRLLIVDTRRAIEEFWQFACKPDLVDKLMEKTGDPSRWQNHDTYLVPGNEAAWQGKVDPQEQANEYASQGRLKRDPYLLRQAASAYRNARNQYEAGKCLAYALELEGKYPDAAAKYRELALNDEAFRCYWIGQKWNSVLELAASEPNLTGRLESRAADFMTQRPKLPDPTFWSSLVAATKDEKWLKEAATDTSWHEVFARLVDTFSKLNTDNTIPWIEIHETFRRIRERGVRLNENHLGIIAFQARDYQEAVSMWEQSKNTDRRDYLVAKAHVDPSPEKCIVGFFRLKDFREVIRLWREQYTGRPPIHQFDHATIAAVIDAALAEGELSLAARLLEAKPDQDRVVKLIAASMERKAHTATIAGAVIAARLLVRNRDWTAAIEAAEDARFNLRIEPEANKAPEKPQSNHPRIEPEANKAPEKPQSNHPRIEPEANKAPEKPQSDHPRIEPEALRSILQQTGGTTRVFAAVIQELAVSEDLVSTRDQKEKVQEFLNRNLIISRGSSRIDRAGINPEVAGAAIERAGKIVDALQFYEDLERGPQNEAIRKFAAERLIRNLERLADYSQEVKKDEVEAQRRRARARAIREQYGFSEQRQIPEYPVIQQSNPRECDG